MLCAASIFANREKTPPCALNRLFEQSFRIMAGTPQLREFVERQVLRLRRQRGFYALPHLEEVVPFGHRQPIRMNNDNARSALFLFGIFSFFCFCILFLYLVRFRNVSMSFPVSLHARR